MRRKVFEVIGVILVLVLSIAIVAMLERGGNENKLSEAKNIEFVGDVYSKSYETLDDAGYSMSLLVCSLKEQNVNVKIHPSTWIDKRAVTYVLLPKGAFPQGFLDNLSKKLGSNVTFKNVSISALKYKNGTITYHDHLRKGECFVLSFRAVFKKPGIPDDIKLNSLGETELSLPSAKLNGTGTTYTLGIWVPGGYDSWSLSVLVPRKLGRNETYQRELEQYLSSMLGRLKKGIFPVSALKKPNSNGPKPPEDYCAELKGPGDLIYTQRPIDFSGLYSDGSYYESDFSGSSSRWLSLNVTVNGTCEPAVWVTFRGEVKSMITGPLLSRVSISGTNGSGAVFNSELDLVEDLVVEPGAR